MAAAEVAAADATVPESPVAPAKLAPVAAPDKDGFQRKLAAMQTQMAKLKTEGEAADASLDSVRSGTESAMKEFSDARSNSEALRAESKAARSRVSGLLDRFTALRKRRDDLQTALRERRTGARPDELRSRIDALELRQATTTMSLNDERELIKQISELQKQLRELATSESSRASMEAERVSVEAELKEVNDLIKVAKEEEAKVRVRIETFEKVFQAIKSSRDASRARIDELNAKKADIGSQKKKLYTDMKALNDAHYSQLRAYNEYRDALRVQREAERKREAEEFEKSAEAEKEARRKEEEDRRPDHPWAVELVELDMLLAFLRKASPEAAAEHDKDLSSAAAADSAPTPVPVKVAAPTSTFAPGERIAFGISLGGRPPAAAAATKGATSGAGDDDAAAAAAGKGSAGRRGGRRDRTSAKKQEVSFDLETLGMLAKFGVAPPTVTDEIKATLARVTALRAEYAVKPAKGSAARAAAPAEAAAAPAEAATPITADEATPSA